MKKATVPAVSAFPDTGALFARWNGRVLQERTARAALLSAAPQLGFVYTLGEPVIVHGVVRYRLR